MITATDIKASVLPVVLVVSVIMMLIILGLLSHWDMNFLYFSRNDYTVRQRLHIESFLTLYSAHPEIASDIEADSTYTLYGDISDSRIKVSVSPWGLYEVVCASSLCSGVRVARIFGAAVDPETQPVLWYRNHGSSITVTGKTEIIGRAALPANGLIYGQMQAVFFSGNQLPAPYISVSDKEMPEPDELTLTVIEEIFSAQAIGHISSGEEVKARFHDTQAVILSCWEEVLSNVRIDGKVMITGDRITIDSTCMLNNVIIAANYIEITENVKGRMQLMAKDSIRIEKDVLLDFPSGLYCENKITIGERSVINGYVVNNFTGTKETLKANTVKAKSSKVRGLLYSKGIAQVQGIITGASYIDEAVFYAPQGYYRNLIYDASFIESGQTLLPLWLDRDTKRKTIGWVD